MFTLRPATPADCDAIRSIYAPYILETAVSFETEVPSHETFAERMRGIMEFFPYLIAEASGEVIGYAYAHFAYERAAYRWNAELSVYLRRGAEKRGVGSALYAALIELLRAQGFKKLYGVVAMPNEASERLHERFGFAPAARFEKHGYKFGRWHDVVWFEKRLAPFDAAPADPIPFSALDAGFVEQVLAEAAGHFA